MGMFTKIGLRAVALLIAGFVAALGLGTNTAQAGCRFVATLCGQAQPQVYYEQNGYSESQYSREDVVRTQSADGYDQGYQDGLRAAGAKARAHTTKHRATAKARGTSTHRATTRSHTRRATVQARSQRTVARTSRTYRSNQAGVRRPYEMPIKDHAATYRASAVGYSVPIAAYAGRGESWVSGQGQIVRYSAPQHISVQNGQNCGWGMGIAQSGQSSGNRAWVCHCEHGWQPPH